MVCGGLANLHAVVLPSWGDSELARPEGGVGRRLLTEGVTPREQVLPVVAARLAAAQ